MEPGSSIIGIDNDYPREKYFFDNMNNVGSCINLKILSQYLQFGYYLFYITKRIFLKRDNFRDMKINNESKFAKNIFHQSRKQIGLIAGY